jgi:hypothetical protein
VEVVENEAGVMQPIAHHFTDFVNTVTISLMLYT